MSGPTIMGDTCCYEVETQGPCGIGRPLVVGERAVTARATRSDAWSRTPKADPIASLDDTDRAILSAAWTHDALYEHASVASFSRFALELMALGAPPELVAAAHQAALDELEHAKLCFALASRFAGEPVGAGPLDAARDLSVRADLKQLAVATFFEGCVGETLAALTAAEQRDRATDEATRSALTTIAEDEARHAELAWQTVAWALDIGGDDVRRALSAAVHEAGKHCPELPETDDPRLVAFGRLPAADVAALHRRAILDVVMPCAQALLARA
ncbi:MAG: ferritin-like domain-containing protein [Polyangiaceae bacterium]